jgi:hypothetical protein
MWREVVANVFLDFRISNAGKMPSFLNEQSEYPDGRHIVVTGFSRSETTMFYNMLRSSMLGFLLPDQEVPASAVIGRDARNMVTKRPLDVFNVQDIYKANTCNKAIDFIIIIRDIRAVITSKHAAVPDDYFMGYDHQYYLYPDGRYEFSNPGVVATFNAIAQLMQSNLPGKKIIIRYEDLVSSTIEVQESLAKQLELRYRDRFDRFNRREIPSGLGLAMNDLSPPDPGRALKWKAAEHYVRIQQQFTDCPRLFEILKATGYEKDDAWFKRYSE